MTRYSQHLHPAPTPEHEAWRRKWLWAAAIVPIAGFVLGHWFWVDLPIPTGAETRSAEITSVYRQDNWCSAAIFLFGAFALYYAAYLVATLGFRDPLAVSRREKALHFMIWTVFPPIFFFVEWFILYPKFGVKSREALEAFKQGQEVTRNLWAGFVALFAASYLADALKAKGE